MRPVFLDCSAVFFSKCIFHKYILWVLTAGWIAPPSTLKQPRFLGFTDSTCSTNVPQRFWSVLTCQHHCTKPDSSLFGLRSGDMDRCLSGDSHQKMVPCGHTGMDMVSSNAQASCGEFKPFLTGPEGLLKAVLAPPSAAAGRQDVSTLPCC